MDNNQYPPQFPQQHNVVGNSPLNPQNPQSHEYRGPLGGGPAPYQQPLPPKPPKKHTVRNILLAIAGVFVLFVGGCTAIVASVGGAVDDATKQPAASTASTQPVDNGPTPDPLITPTNKPSSNPPAVAKTTAPPAAKTTTQPAKPEVTKPAMTASQEQAVGTAEDYLNGQAFSRKGLIEQLKFEGFSTKDATYGVDHVAVSWNEQAALSAKQYLNGQHFSRSGLIGQLEYEGFTHSQAVYGVKKAGL